jgi:uncharacterized SAM-binding protein YcdF (DUF218 family)
LPIGKQSCTIVRVSFRERIAQSVYDFLDVGKSPRPADCIFVLAGKQERKSYGIRMWRFGYASQLILSVGRFEWRKFSELDLESDGGLEAMVDQTPAKKRHFFVRLDRQEAFCTPVRTRLLGTRSEARALADYLRDVPARSLLVISSPAHLRRAALAFSRAFRKTRIQITFVAVPEKPSFALSETRTQIWSEFRKYVLYRLFL